MQVRLLGPLELDDGDAPITVGGARLRALLARLALDAGRSVSTDALALALWDDAVPDDTTNAVQSLVSRLRRALPDPALVQSHPAGYRLRIAPEDVDALRFRRLARLARDATRAGADEEADRCRREALALWRGAALSDLGDPPFARADAARLEDERRTLDEARLAALLAAGRPAEAVGDLTALVAADPEREPAVALLMQAQFDLGRPADALRTYETLRGRLAAQLGADPSPAVQALHLELLRGERVSPTATTTAPPSRLPAQLTSFLGREDELARLDALLQRERLVTLVGPGGAGKTRLAIETASRHSPHLPAALVELAPVSDAREIPQAALDALAIREQRVLDPNRYGRVDARTRIVDHLRGAPYLLLLDNCEHLVEGAAQFTADLLAHCPELRVLATSREALAITGEVVFPVPMLARPGAGADLAEARATASVRLFLDRATAAAPGFTLDKRTRDDVVELCRRLDGLPLAIELAAARMRAMTVHQLAARLDDRFRLLTGGRRDAVARHRTLRAVVEWSWDLLDEEERSLAERFSVFPGGATVAAVRAVCMPPETSLADSEDALARLADKSLIALVAAGEPRYRMLETLREYGAERLGTSLPAVRRTHARYFRDEIERLEPMLRSAGQLAAFACIELERDNLLAALRFSIDSADADTAMRIAAGLGWYWLVNDSHAEAAAWCSAALAVPGTTDAQTMAMVTGLYLVNALAADTIPLADRAAIEATFRTIPDVDRDASHPLLALLGPAAAFLATPPGDWQAAVEQALQHPDPWAKGALHLLSAAMHANAGAAEQARQEVSAALGFFRSTGDRWGIARCLHGLGDALLVQDELDGAREAYREALTLFAELGVGSSDEVQLQLQLARVEAHAGNRQLAAELLSAAETGAARSGSRQARCLVAIAQAMTALAEGHLDAAVAAHARATAAAEGARVAPQLRAVLLASAGLLALAVDDDPARAGDRFATAYEVALSSHDMPITALVAQAAASWALAVDRAPDAARLLGAGAALLGIGTAAAERGGRTGRDPQVAAATEAAVKALGADEFARCYRELALLTPPEAAQAAAALFGRTGADATT